MIHSLHDTSLTAIMEINKEIKFIKWKIQNDSGANVGSIESKIRHHEGARTNPDS